jgi:hypothetical protein
VTIRREAPARRRFLEAKSRDGRTATLDFGVEPGIIKSGATSASADPHWTQRSGPLSQQIQEFLSVASGGTPEDAGLALRGSVALAERCDALLKRGQKSWLALDRSESELRYALRDLLSPSLYERGLAEPGDAQALDYLADDALRRFRNGTPVDALLPEPVTSLPSVRR